MRDTRQYKARKMLIGMGITGASGFTEKSLGAKPDRNRSIVQMVIFDGATLKSAGAAHGVSTEQARVVALGSVRRLTGKYQTEQPE